MTYSSDLVPNDADREKPPGNAVIEIQLWDAYVNDRNGVIGRFLVKYSVGEAPSSTQNISTGRIAYRFANDTWFRDVKPSLIKNRIPVSLRLIRIESTFEQRNNNLCIPQHASGMS